MRRLDRVVLVFEGISVHFLFDWVLRFQSSRIGAKEEPFGVVRMDRMLGNIHSA